MSKSLTLKIGHVAAIVHAANTEYCEAIGEPTFPLSAVQESVEAGIRAVLDGSVQNPGDSHESWLAFKEADGWKYGPVKDLEKKEHPCFLPFEELPPQQQVKDYLFLGIVRAFIVNN